MEKLFVANYKMNGNKNFYQKVNKVVNKLKTKDTVILCPPFVYMPFFKIKNKNVFLGAQDVSANENKQSTGQTKAEMLNDLGASFVIIGHSERREIGEDNELVSLKVAMAQKHNLTPIVCVGEKLKTAKLDIVIEQVKTALNNANKNKTIIFAYEPVWAIGTGEQPTASKINQVLKIIKDAARECGFDVKVLYGGSVNLSNYKHVSESIADGFLMGGVSLKIDEFMKIVKGE